MKCNTRNNSNKFLHCHPQRCCHSQVTPQEGRGRQPHCPHSLPQLDGNQQVPKKNMLKLELDIFVAYATE
jgi:hypothetical protein